MTPGHTDLPELPDDMQQAVDHFFAGWKGKIETRLREKMAEKGDTLTFMPHDEIMQLMMTELTDFMAYAVFFQWKEGGLV